MVGVRRAPLVALIGIAAALVSVGPAACTGQAGAVTVGSAARGDVTEVVDSSATVTAKAVGTLTAPATGTIASLAVTPGTTVQAGQLVAVISSPAAQQQLQQAATALAAAKNTGGGFSGGADLAVAQKKTDDAAAKAFDSARRAASAVGDPAVRDALLAQIDAAAQQYASLAATSRSLVGSVQRGIGSLSAAVGALGAAQRVQAQSAYDLAQSTVDSLTLRAPIAGVVQFGGVRAGSSGGGSLGDLLGSIAGGGAGAAAAGAGGGGANAAAGPGVDDAATVGAQVGAGTPIATVVDVSSLGVIAEVDETDVLLVSPGVPANVELDAAPGAGYAATVRNVDLLPTTSTSGGVAYRVRLSLGPGRYSDGRPAPTPRPGMSAVAHLSVRQARDTVTVPAAAVFSVDGHDAVWLVRGGHAVQTPVTVGVQGQDRVEIASGIGAGDQLVVRGTDQVKAGQTLP
jgi:multidrug efflux pump subunit AcrA (membrane-fusion protein)